MYHLECYDEWVNIHCEDLWVYNKLFLSRILGYNCGPSGVPVPKSDFYIIRPSFNLMGMSRFSRIEWVDNDTEHFHPSEFWCEIFEGEHLSVDYRRKKADLIVKGYRDPESSLYRWSKWEKVERHIEFPSVLENLKGDYEWINCEFIGGKLIEVHFRRNPNFRYGNTIAIPVWNDENVPKDGKYKYIEDSDYLRKGFLVD